MRIGDLKHRVEIQAQTKSADGMGGFAVSYSTLATVFCAIWPTSANEVISANSPSMVVTHRIRMRYRSTMKSSFRIKLGNRYFSIISIINPNEANQYLDLMCKEAA